MSKFCTNCGAQLQDNAAFCTNCGATQQTAQQSTQQTFQQTTQQPAQQTTQQTPENAYGAYNYNNTAYNSNGDAMAAPKKSGKAKFIVLGVIAVAVIAAVVIVIVMLFGGGYKKPLDNYFKSIEDGDAKTFMEAYPECYIDYIDDMLGVSGMDMDVEEFFQETVDGLLETFESDYGENISISYKIEDKEKLSDSELEDISDEFKDNIDANVDVTSGYELDLEVTIEGDDDDDTDSGSLTVAKIDGEWYIVENDGESLF